MTENTPSSLTTAIMDRIETRMVPMMAIAAAKWFQTYVATVDVLDPAHAACARRTVETKVEIIISPGTDSAVIRLVTMDGEGEELVVLRSVELRFDAPAMQ